MFPGPMGGPKPHRGQRPPKGSKLVTCAAISYDVENRPGDAPDASPDLPLKVLQHVQFSCNGRDFDIITSNDDSKGSACGFESNAGRLRRTSTEFAPSLGSRLHDL